MINAQKQTESKSNEDSALKPIKTYKLWIRDRLRIQQVANLKKRLSTVRKDTCVDILLECTYPVFSELMIPVFVCMACGSKHWKIKPEPGKFSRSVHYSTLNIYHQISSLTDINQPSLKSEIESMVASIHNLIWKPLMYRTFILSLPSSYY